MPGQKPNNGVEDNSNKSGVFGPPRPSRKAFGLHQQAESAESAQAPSVSPEQVGRAGSTIPSWRVCITVLLYCIDIIVEFSGYSWIFPTTGYVLDHIGSLSLSLSTYCMYAFGTRERIKLMRTCENNIARPFNTRYWTLSLKVQLPKFEHPDPTNLIELSSQEGSIAHHPGISAIDSQIIIVCREMCHIQTLAFD